MKVEGQEEEEEAEGGDKRVIYFLIRKIQMM